MTTAALPGSRDREVTVSIPRRSRALPPVVARHMRRAVLVYTAIWLLGLFLAVAGAGDALTALGLGLMLPGGGFLYGSAPLLFAFAFIAFVLAVAIWWATGPTVLPPAVWLAAALLGTGGDETSEWAAIAVPATVPVLLAAAYGVHRVRHVRHLRTNAALNARLADVTVTITGPPSLDTGLLVAASSDEDLARLRYGLDLALQPLDEFAGFTKLDQYREAATRYQLNALGYSLSMSQFTRTPAFSGYLAEAQRNAIEKMLDRRVFGYWARENLWGNLALNADPVDTNENIMLTGFHGLMVGMYESLNDDRYSRPGGLTYRWSDTKGFAHDFGALAAQIHSSMARSSFTLFPCEPNWIYTVCNTYGLNTLISHDRLHGTRYAEEVGEQLRRSYETEFLRPDGRIIGVRSTHLGLSWNFWAGDAVQLTTAFWLHAGLPEIAQRTWWLLREKGLRIVDGRLVLPSYPTVKLDPGNYMLKRDTFAQVVAMLAAREVGDEEYALAAAHTLSDREPVAERDGAQRWSEASGMANLYGNLARFNRRSGLRDLVAHDVPDVWRTGPRLAEAAYPEVLVARAVTDGHALDLTLVPGAGPVRTTLLVDRLIPGGAYEVSGAVAPSVVAAASGRALIEVELDRRREIRVY